MWRQPSFKMQGRTGGGGGGRGPGVPEPPIPFTLLFQGEGIVVNKNLPQFNNGAFFSSFPFS